MPSPDLPTRCDECGAPRRDALPCPQCGALPAATREEPARVDGPRALAAWRLARASTLAYGLAQVALMLASGALAGVPWGHVAARAALLLPLLAIPLLAARRRALGWLVAWTAVLCAGAPAALALMALGVVPAGALPALTLATGALWAVALALAAWRVSRDRR